MPTAEQVRDECKRRILALYPVVDQLSLMREGGAELTQMGYQIDALRACSRAICVMAPIPVDFRDDRWWRARAAAPVAPSQPAPAPAAAPIVIVVPQPAATPFDQVHTVAAPAVTPGHQLPAPVVVTATQDAGRPTPMKPIVVDAKDASASIIHAASEITTAIWSQADEVRSEAATRSIRGSEASLNMLREAADVAGMSLDDYRADLLIRRAAAHHAILAVDKAKDRALDALAVDGVNVAAVMAQFSNEVRGING